MAVLLSRRVADLTPVFHGSVTDADLKSLGLARTEVMDFSVNANPLGPSPSAVAAAVSAQWASYPDDAATELREALAARDGVNAAEVVVGNGSAELLWLLALAFVEAGDAALIIGPTFGEYARAARIAGGVVTEHRANPADGFAVRAPEVVAHGRAVGARVVFICNPNNPTGTLLPLAALRELAEALSDGLVVIDEAYRQFVDHPPPTPELLTLGNVVLVRSLTKDYALTGLRLGYALAPAPIRIALDAVRPPWSVNAVAQAAGLAALEDETHLQRARDEVRRAQTYLATALTERDLRVLPAAANFLLVEVGNGAAVRSALLRLGVCVRDCASFGLPGYLRIGLRTVPECERLVAAFDDPAVRRVIGVANG